VSATPSESLESAAAHAASGRSLFAYEVRRDGRVVATLKGQQTATGTIVETAVFPVTAPHDDPGLTRPFTFGSADHARRFADEALVVFEYLNCTVS